MLQRLERKIHYLNKFILDHLDVFYKQANPVEGEFRKVLIADLKSTKTGGEWEIFPTFESFQEYAIKRIQKFGRDHVLAVYVTKERYTWDGAIKHIDLVMDIDGKENDFSSLEKIKKLKQILTNEYGIEPLFKLSGNGIHIQLQHDIFTYNEKIKESEFQDIINKTYINLARDLEKRTGIKFDEKVYSSGRLFRAVYSPHETQMVLAIPFNPDNITTWNELIQHAKQPIIPQDTTWGRITDLIKFSINLGNIYTITKNIEAQKKEITSEEKTRKIKKKHGMQSITLDDGRIIKYDASLDGYGYLRVMIEEKIPLEDAREDFIWYALSKAYVKKIITKREAYDYIKLCYETNPTKPLENYIKKFETNIKQDIHPPTFQTILTLKDKTSTQLATLEHIREEILKALEKRGKIMIL
jgi:hypothetical protein